MIKSGIKSSHYSNQQYVLVDPMENNIISADEQVEIAQKNTKEMLDTVNKDRFPMIYYLLEMLKSEIDATQTSR